MSRHLRQSLEPESERIIKTIHICQSYSKNKSDTFLWTIYIILLLLSRTNNIYSKRMTLKLFRRWSTLCLYRSVYDIGLPGKTVAQNRFG